MPPALRMLTSYRWWRNQGAVGTLRHKPCSGNWCAHMSAAQLDWMTLP